MSVEENLLDALVKLVKENIVISELTLDQVSYEKLKSELGYRWDEKYPGPVGYVTIKKAVK